MARSRYLFAESDRPHCLTCTIVEYDENHPPDPEERVKWLESIET